MLEVGVSIQLINLGEYGKTYLLEVERGAYIVYY